MQRNVHFTNWHGDFYKKKGYIGQISIKNRGRTNVKRLWNMLYNTRESGKNRKQFFGNSNKTLCLKMTNRVFSQKTGNETQEWNSLLHAPKEKKRVLQVHFRKKEELQNVIWRHKTNQKRHFSAHRRVTWGQKGSISMRFMQWAGKKKQKPRLKRGNMSVCRRQNITKMNQCGIVARAGLPKSKREEDSCGKGTEREESKNVLPLQTEKAESEGASACMVERRTLRRQN